MTERVDDEKGNNFAFAEEVGLSRQFLARVSIYDKDTAAETEAFRK